MQEQPQLPQWMQSSMDPTKVANTIKGVGTLFSGTILIVLALSNHPTDQASLQAIINVVATQSGILVAGVGAAWTLYGLIMKGLMLAVSIIRSLLSK